MKTVRTVAVMLSLALLLCVFAPTAAAAETPPSGMPDPSWERFETDLQARAAADQELTEPRTVDQIKTIADFAGNPYYLIECAPIGYMIYNPTADTYMEYSLWAPSPYLGMTEDMVYGGPMEYFQEDQGAYTHTVTRETIPEEAVALYETQSKTLQANLRESKKEKANLAAAAAITETYVQGGNLFPKITTESQIGYIPGGHCGYIAAGLLLLYFDRIRTDSLINDRTYLNQSGETYKSVEEQSSSYKPLSKYIKDKYGDNRGTAAVDFPVGNAKGIDGVIDGCFGEQGITYSHWAKITATFDDLVFALLKEYNLPLILFGRLPDVSGDDSLCDHAVIAYGYTSDDMLIVHYGWENYSKVILDNIIYMSGSMYQITSCSAPTSDPCYPFSDLSYHWARKYISNCVEHGCMGGTTATKWAPEISMTRAMFVTVLYRMAGSPATTISHPFTDVPSSSYYAKAVSWAYKNNLVNGTAATTFTPDRAVTREQSVCFLHRFATFRNYMYSTHSVSTSRYPD